MPLFLIFMTQLNILKLNEYAKLPYKAHEADACFDLFSNLKDATAVSTTFLQPSPLGNGFITSKSCLPVIDDCVSLPPLSSTIIPTGICMGIPEGYRIDINARSGRAAKYMQQLTNGVGIVDAGYEDEVKVILLNLSGDYHTIQHHDKIAQFHLEKVRHIELNVVADAANLGQTTNRQGGLGSTGDN